MPVQERAGAVKSPQMVNIVSEGFVQPYLSIVGWVNNVAYQKDVWLDTYGFDASGEMMDRARLPLRYQAPAGGGGDLFDLHGIVGPSVAIVAYRIYYKVVGSVFTDGRLHTAVVARDQSDNLFR
jgi:hypothetical protein